jgi:endo-1,3(4)-beta-glucanase
MKFKNVSLSLISIIFIAACGGGGGGSSTEPTTPITPTNPSITSFNSSSTSIFEGESITLNWSSANANSCSASGDWSGTKSANGNETLQLASVKTYTFTLTCSGASGTTNAVSSVSVEVNAIPNPTIDSFSSSAQSVSVNESITLSWSTSNTTECSADGDWTGSKELDGTETLELTSVKTYTFDLTCTGAKEIAITESVSIVVEGEQTEDLDVHIIGDGDVAEIWGGEDNLFFFDELNGYQSCKSDSCQSVDWSFVDSGTSRGNVLEVVYKANAGHAGLVVGPSASVNLSDYSEGNLSFDIKVTNKGDDNLPNGFLVKVESGSQNSGELAVEGIIADGSWETVDFPVSKLTQSGALNLSAITVPIVFFPSFQTGENLVYQIDNIRYTGIKDGATPPSGPNDGGGTGTGDYQLLTYGAGSVSNKINPNSYRCVFDYGNWIYNAGVVQPGISGCNTDTGTPTGEPTKVVPQIVEPALSKKLATHRWWGSIPFLGEMKVDQDGAAAHVTADPMRARVSNKGVKLMGLPGGYQSIGTYPRYEGPVPFAEVFDGIAISNSQYTELDAFLKDYSDASVTVMWKSGNVDVMEATFVHGSPYAYFKVYAGNPIIKTKATNSAEKGTFYEYGNNLGVWTDVAGIKNYFVITGEGTTEFSNIDSNEIAFSNSSKEFTVTYIPTLSGVPNDNMTEYFVSYARNIVSSVEIDHEVNDQTNEVTVTHVYLDNNGSMVDTIVGMHPMHWKFSDANTSSYKIRSARGMIKFAQLSDFNYKIPSVGILPTLPAIANSYDQATLEQFVKDFVEPGERSWIYDGDNMTIDTYWSGKAYGKVAEVAAIANTLGMDNESSVLINWLKSELSDWFNAETDGQLDETRYFVYDDQWDTILGMDEAYGSHQRLADHHFHYGYFVRAAAEICRVDKSWCSEEQYGPMIELLIRDYAASDDDDMFPPTRNFDPANGFSWADGRADALAGNNNESTSEAATAYGAIILYGLATGNDDLVKKGTYLHASTSAAYWQYWNNIDGYKNRGGDHDNFINGYNLITTSIIWSAGADFSTWFSPKRAHILGIQGLPSSPLIFHVGLYEEYMADYVELGLSESSNGRPSGLGDDEWKDLWWNLWAMVDAESSIQDYNSVNGNYDPEAGESKAHTYQWIHVFDALGTLQVGTGSLTSNHPAAVAFKKNGVTTYVAYNYENNPITVSYSDGKSFSVPANSFKIEN